MVLQILKGIEASFIAQSLTFQTGARLFLNLGRLSPCNFLKTLRCMRAAGNSLRPPCCRGPQPVVEEYPHRIRSPRVCGYALNGRLPRGQKLFVGRRVAPFAVLVCADRLIKNISNNNIKNHVHVSI